MVDQSTNPNPSELSPDYNWKNYDILRALDRANLGLIRLHIIPGEAQILDITPAITRLFGYTLEEIQALGGILPITAPDDQQITLDAINSLATGQVQAVTLEKRFIHKDGHVIWMRVNSIVEAINAPDDITAVVVYQDITDEVAQNDLLDLQRRKYEAFMKATDDCVIMINSNDIITDANPAVEEMFGYAVDEVIGQDLALIMPKELAQQHKEAFNKHLATDNPLLHKKGFLTRGLTKTGDMPYLKIALTEMRLGDGDQRIFAGTIRDVTELMITEGVLQDFMENAPFGIIITGWDGEILSANPALVNILGYENEQELKNIDTGKLYGEESIRAQFRSKIENLGTVEELTVDLKRKDGSTVTCEITAIAQRNSKDQIMGYVGLIKDMTAYQNVKALELQLVSEKASRSARLEIMKAVVHDLNQPITIAMLKLEKALWLNRNEEETTLAIEEAKDQLREYMEQLDLLHKAIQLEGDDFSFELTDMPVSTFVESVRDLAASNKDLASGKNLLFSVQVKADAESTGIVKIDNVWMKMAIRNLITNAIKYTNSGTVLVKIEQSRTNIRISIIDSGKGIPEDEVDKVFNINYRARNSYGEKGSGIGLFIVKKVIAGHGGNVELQTVENKGSNFTINLPIY